MKLHDRVRIRSNGLTGEIVDEGYSNNKHYFIVELDDQTQRDFLPACSPDDLEVIQE